MYFVLLRNTVQRTFVTPVVIQSLLKTSKKCCHDILTCSALQQVKRVVVAELVQSEKLDRWLLYTDMDKAEAVIESARGCESSTVVMGSCKTSFAAETVNFQVY